MSLHSEITRIKNASEKIRGKAIDLALNANYLINSEWTYGEYTPDGQIENPDLVTYNNVTKILRANHTNSSYTAMFSTGSGALADHIRVTPLNGNADGFYLEVYTNTGEYDDYGGVVTKKTNVEPKNGLCEFISNSKNISSFKVVICSEPITGWHEYTIEIFHDRSITIAPTSKIDAVADAVDSIPNNRHKTIKIDVVDGSLDFTVNGVSHGETLPDAYYGGNIMEFGNGLTLGVAQSATATADDILIGKTAVTKDGLVSGKNIGRQVEVSFPHGYGLGSDYMNDFDVTIEDTWFDITNNCGANGTGTSYNLTLVGDYISFSASECPEPDGTGCACEDGDTVVSYLAYPDGRPVHKDDHPMPIAYITIAKLPEELLAEI